MRQRPRVSNMIGATPTLEDLAWARSELLRLTEWPVQLVGYEISAIEDMNRGVVPYVGTQWERTDDRFAPGVQWGVYARLSNGEAAWLFDAGIELDAVRGLWELVSREPEGALSGDGSVDDEYGVCACSHGKSDHHVDPVDNHPFCSECPRGQDHHEYVSDDPEGE